MRQTKILYPLETDVPKSDTKKSKDTWKSMKMYLDDIKEGEEISHDELLLKLKVTEENYLLAIRSSINTPTICLSTWRANMDIQYVLYVYACAVYIIIYVSKAQKGNGELLGQACTEARKGNADVKQQVRDIGGKFMNNVEISAQEAVYIVLQLPIKKKSIQRSNFHKYITSRGQSRAFKTTK